MAIYNIGFKIVYQQSYDTVTYRNDIEIIKNQCGYRTTLCLAGGKVGSDRLELIACGNCMKITTETSRNSPNLIESNYWYYHPGLSMGFSRSPNIIQEPYDIYDLNDNLILSWTLDHLEKSRLGALLPGSNYNKYIFIKDSLNLECPKNWFLEREFNCALHISSEYQLTIIEVYFDDGTSTYFETTVSVINFKKVFNSEGIHTIRAYVSIYQKQIEQQIMILKRKLNLVINFLRLK